MTTLSWGFPDTVESVVRSRENGPLIATAAALHMPDNAVVLDVTYGRGNFWTKYRPDFLIAHDIRDDGVDFRNLPEDDESVDVVVFDPPYIVGGGIATTTISDFNDRFGVLDSEHAPRNVDELEDLFRDGMTEARRVLRPGGLLWVKCMDFVSGGKYQAMRHHVASVAADIGLVQVDEFVHASGTGPQPPGTRQQRTSRRAHSFLCIFKKGAKR